MKKLLSAAIALLLGAAANAQPAELDYPIQVPQLELTEQASDRSCAAGDYWIAAKSTSGKIRKCEDGVLSDVDTTGGGGSGDKITNGVGPDVALISTSTCPSGAFHDVDRAGDFDFGTDRCVTADEIKWARNYKSGSSTTQGVQEAIDSCGEGSSSGGCIIGVQASPNSQLDITESIVLGSLIFANRQNNITLLGVGGIGSTASGTTLRYTGASLAANRGVLEIQGDGVHLVNIHINANDLADFAGLVTGSNATSTLSRMVTIRDSAFTDARVAGIQVGEGNGATDVQIDNLSMENVWIDEPDSSGTFMDYCFRTSAINAIVNKFRNVRCNGFDVDGFNIANGTVDIDQATVTSTRATGWAVNQDFSNVFNFAIRDSKIELVGGGGCLNKTNGGAGAYPFQSILWENTPCMLDGANSSKHINYNAAGTLTIIASSFYEGSSRTGAPTDRVTIGNTDELTTPLQVNLFGVSWGGRSTKPLFQPTFQNGVIPRWPKRERYADDYAVGSSTAGVNEAFLACGEGSTTDDQGCIVWGPKGTKTITAMIDLGGLTLSTMQNGIVFLNHGAGFESSSGDKLCGTTYVWGGAAGGTMMQVSGFHHRLGDFCLDGNDTAGYGLLFKGDNGASSPTGKNIVQNVTIEDVLDGTTGWGVAFGNSNLGQNDHTTLVNVQVINSRGCLLQVDSQAIQNRIEQFDCGSFTGPRAIWVQQGAISFYDYFISPVSANSGAVGVAVDSGATTVRFDEGSIEWPADNGTVFRFSDGGFGFGNGNTYGHFVGRTRFQMQFDATTEHTCVEAGTRASLTLIGNTWTNNGAAAARKCDLEFNNPDATRAVEIFMAGNRSAWNNGTDLTDIARTVTSTGGAPIRITRSDLGRMELIDASGSAALSKDATGLYLDADDDGVKDANEPYLMQAAELNAAESIAGAWDFTTGSLAIPGGTTLPATCTVRQQFMDTDAPTGQRHYLCEATNSWVLQGGGGGPALPVSLANGGTGTDTSAFGGSIFGLISGSFTDIDTWAEIASAIGVSNTALDASGNLTVRTLITADLDGSNFIDLFDNATGTPSCASLIAAGKVGLLDSDASASLALDVCNGTALLWRFPATSTTTTQALFATGTAGAPAFRALATGDLPAGATLDTEWDTSAEIRAAMSDEIGTGALMFGLISTMADDLACTGSQVVRRNPGDTAFECATVSAGGMSSFNADGDNNSPQTIGDANELLIAGGTNGIDTVASATDTVTINLDPSEFDELFTFHDGVSAVAVHTIALSGADDPAWSYDNLQAIFDTVGSNAPVLGVADQGEFRWFEDATNGSNYVGVRAPAAITSNVLVDLENDATPWPVTSMFATANEAGLEAGFGSIDVIVGTDLASGIKTWFGTPSSANLRSAITDETGTGALMFGITASMADDLTCGASQVLRRNAGDTAWECAAVSGSGISYAEAAASVLAGF